MSVRSRLSWWLSGADRIARVEATVIDLQTAIAELTARQDAALDEIRGLVRTALDDLDARVVSIDDQLAEQ